MSEVQMGRNEDKTRTLLTASIGLTVAFALWTLLVQVIDVQAVGPLGSSVGFATPNLWFHELTGVHMSIYDITDWLSLVPIFVCLGFAVLVAVQMIRRRSLLRVDADLLLLMLHYAVVVLLYLLFEKVVINYRPVLIDGELEASYPSSTTLLVLSVMPTLIFQVDRRCTSPSVQSVVRILAIVFSAGMVIGRLVSGVHWITDIAGGVLLSAAVLMFLRLAVAHADEKARGTHTKE